MTLLLAVHTSGCGVHDDGLPGVDEPSPLSELPPEDGPTPAPSKKTRNPRAPRLVVAPGKLDSGSLKLAP